MIQEILTYTLITAAIGHTMFGMYKAIFAKRKKTACPGCASGCSVSKKKDYFTKERITSL